MKSMPKELDEVTHAAIGAEAIRAQAVHGAHNTPINPNMSRGQKLAILVEEVGEIAHELCEISLGNVSDTTNLIKELIQVSSVAAAWAQSEDILL